MPGSSPVVKARLNPELHRRFETLRLSQNLSASELLQRAVENELQASNQAAQPRSSTHEPLAKPPAGSDALEITRLTVRLPAYVREAAAGRAQAKGWRVTPWVAALVQSHIAATPVLTDAELQAVEAAIRELGAIGRNINQIARALNEAHFQTERVRLDRLAELSEKIDSTREAIRSLVRASRNAWGVE
jgi:predicted HicB family RNase H-like nuclease